MKLFMSQPAAAPVTGPGIPLFLLVTELEYCAVIGSTSLNCKFVVDLNLLTEREHLNSVTLQAGVIVICRDVGFVVLFALKSISFLIRFCCFRFIYCNASTFLVKKRNVQRSLQQKTPFEF